MPILFEALEDEVLYAEVPAARLTLTGVALGFALGADSSAMIGSFTFGGSAFAEDGDAVFVPNVPAVLEAGFTFTLQAEAFEVTYEEVEGGFTFGGFGLSLEPSEAAMLGSFSLGSTIVAGNSVETSYTFMVEEPAVIYGTPGSMITTGVQDALVLTTQQSGLLDYVVQSVMRMDDAPTVFARLVATIESSLVVRDFVAVLLDSGVESVLSLDDPLEADLRIIAMLADMLEIGDEPTGTLSALQTVVSALVLADSLAFSAEGNIESELALTEEQSAHVNALVEMISALEMDTEATASMSMLAFVEDALELSDEPGALMALLAELLDNVSFAVRIDTGTAQFSGYTVNLRNAAVTEYDNFNFNSFALVGGKAYGANEAGIFCLEGEDDAGAPIDAFVRTGILNFEELVHVTKAWIGLTSDGEMLLKTITMDRGFKKENWYRMARRPQGSPVDSRFNPAKGLTGAYWQWELENVEGAYFEIDTLKVWPISIGRRYSGR